MSGTNENHSKAWEGYDQLCNSEYSFLKGLNNTGGDYNYAEMTLR